MDVVDDDENRENDSRPSQDDLLLSMTKQKLERLYGMPAVETPDDPTAEGSGDNRTHSSDAGDTEDANNNAPWLVNEPSDIPSKPIPLKRPSDAVDDWTLERMRRAVLSRASERETARKKEKPSIADNAVFAKYKNGSLVQPQQLPSATTTTTSAPSLPPFPSRQHCTGFWRVLSSPTGFAGPDEGDASRSDNLILRVDGTIAGGPILDPGTNQKASGGTWTLQLDPSSERTTATLRINLILPPKKERVLVLEGPLVMEEQPQPRTLVALPTMASNTFGIPVLEERAARAAAAMADDDDDELLLSDPQNGNTNDAQDKQPSRIVCQGAVWVEDAETHRNRDTIGTFSIVKLDTPTDPRQFTITIPRNVRNQD